MGTTYCKPSEIVVDTQPVLGDVLADVRLLRPAVEVRGEVVLEPLGHEEEVRALRQVVRDARGHLRGAEAGRAAHRIQALALAVGCLHVVDLRPPRARPARIPE